MRRILGMFHIWVLMCSAVIKASNTPPEDDDFLLRDPKSLAVLQLLGEATWRAVHSPTVLSQVEVQYCGDELCLLSYDAQLCHIPSVGVALNFFKKKVKRF